MLNAEEKVPSRVWSNIRSRISPAPSNWGWAWGLALACVAAIAIALPLAINDKPAPEEQLAAKVIVVDSAAESLEPSIPEERLSQVLTTAPKQAAPMAEITTEDRIAEPDVHQIAGNAAEMPTVTSVEAEAETSAETTPSEVTGKPVGKSIGEIDAFDRMAMEDNKKSGSNFSITANSTVSGNDSDFLGESSIMFRSSSSGMQAYTGITETGPSVYGIPVSFGLGIRHHFNEKLSIGSGLTYSLLTRSFTGSYNVITEASIRHNMQYLGVPVNLYYSIIGNKVIDFHVFGGGSLEFCVSNSYRISQASGDILLNEPVSGVQFSAGIGLGASFRLNDFLSICIDPSARYYFRSSHPKSLRTDKPFMVNLELGLKFDL